MKNLIALLLIPAVFSCSKPQRASEPFPNLYEVEDELITYEGILPSDDGFMLEAEISLKPGAPGLDSYYWLKESLNERDAQKFFMNTWSQGKYTVLTGSDGNNFIEILNRSIMKAVVRSKNFNPVKYGKVNLYLKSNGDNELILVDENFEEVDPRYTLTRRSDLFTAEGYFTVYDDSTSDFYERNTGKKWPVAQLGHYGEAVSMYHWIAKEKFEGVYVKSLSYSVRQASDDGEEIDAIVFKKILEIKATEPMQ